MTADTPSPWPLQARSVPLQLPKGLRHVNGRLLGLADADAVLALRRRTLATMRPELRVMDPERGCSPDVEAAWAQTHLGPRALTQGVFDADALVGFATVVLPLAQGRDDISRLLGLPATDVARSAHMAACMVAEDYRGLHLQTKLLNWRREAARVAQRSLLLAMTACGNTHSRRNLLAAGLGIRWVGELRPSSWWYILAQDLGPQPPLAGGGEWVDLSRLDRQMALAAQGWVGVSETVWPGTPRLQFVHPVGAALNPGLGAPAENLA